MIKSNFNSKFCQYVQDNISIVEKDRKFVSDVYKSFQDVLGGNNTLQIGSYPRFTAIRPLHDLDILYILGEWDKNDHNPVSLLQSVQNKIKNEYVNPTKHTYNVSLQSHSITIVFKEHGEEIFAVDIVPAYVYSDNEFDQDTYKVPEIAEQKHIKRKQFYKQLQESDIDMGWIHTDPRGYIEITKQVNEVNNDFRRVVKFIKAWKNSHKEEKEEFKLKSFHIEQVIIQYYQENTELEIFDAIFKFFVEIPQIIKNPSIKDRANNHKFIDKYVEELSQYQKNLITQARDCFLKKLEKFSENDSVQEFISPCFYKRVSSSEQFLFDFNIPVLTDNSYNFKIDGLIQQKDGFRDGWLSKFFCKVDFNRKIKFQITTTQPDVDLFKWKVRNDINSKKPRGEITDNRTLRDPEHTALRGNHYVECYAILNNVCVAKARRDVKLN